ncbi:acyl carrier protein [Qipengyuania sp.]|uniref:acyl carrier protein n=1 Tax=Qipengyuania sp. TaxID=2004515 RepID=UPI003AF75297
MTRDIESVVVAAIRKVAKLVDSDTVLTRDTALIEEQLLDSIELLQLVMELETAYGIEIPLEELAPENFADIASVVRLVGRQIGGAAG